MSAALKSGGDLAESAKPSSRSAPPFSQPCSRLPRTKTAQTRRAFGAPQNHTRRITMKLASFAALTVVFAVIFAFVPQPVFAGRSVDPSTLNPPPPPEFNPVCEAVGGGTICTVQFSDPPFAGGTGIICGSGASAFEVFEFQNR